TRLKPSGTVRASRCSTSGLRNNGDAVLRAMAHLLPRLRGARTPPLVAPSLPAVFAKGNQNLGPLELLAFARRGFTIEPPFFCGCGTRSGRQSGSRSGRLTSHRDACRTRRGAGFRWLASLSHTLPAGGRSSSPPRYHR